MTPAPLHDMEEFPDDAPDMLTIARDLLARRGLGPRSALAAPAPSG